MTRSGAKGLVSNLKAQTTKSFIGRYQAGHDHKHLNASVAYTATFDDGSTASFYRRITNSRQIQIGEKQVTYPPVWGKPGKTVTEGVFKTEHEHADITRARKVVYSTGTRQTFDDELALIRAIFSALDPGTAGYYEGNASDNCRVVSDIPSGYLGFYFEPGTTFPKPFHPCDRSVLVLSNSSGGSLITHYPTTTSILSGWTALT